MGNGEWGMGSEGSSISDFSRPSFLNNKSQITNIKQIPTRGALVAQAPDAAGAPALRVTKIQSTKLRII